MNWPTAAVTIMLLLVFGAVLVTAIVKLGGDGDGKE